MRKFFLPILAGALFASCIDKDYDLSEINTDDITIGDEIRFPLATIRVTMQELKQGSLDIEKIFAQADDWLPTTLPGKADYVDIVELNRHGAYLDELINALIDEMKQPDGQKLETVAERICDDYKQTFLSLLGLPFNVSDELFKSTFKTEFMRQQAVQEASKTTAHDYLGDIGVSSLPYKIDGVDITSDVVDMLCDNLDPESTPPAQRRSTLHLYGEIRSKLPVSLLLEPDFKPTRLSFSVRVDATSESNPIDESDDTLLLAEDLRQIVEGVTIDIPVTLEKYYPAIGFRSGEQEQITIDLRLVKRGGLKLNL